MELELEQVELEMEPAISSGLLPAQGLYSLPLTPVFLASTISNHPYQMEAVVEHSQPHSILSDLI